MEKYQYTITTEDKQHRRHVKVLDVKMHWGRGKMAKKKGIKKVTRIKKGL